MNANDWARLIELRERRLRHAQEAVAHEQRDVRAAADELQRASTERERRVSFKHEQTQALMRSVANGERVLPQLREADAYRRSLDSLVAQAHRVALAAQAKHGECMARWRACLRGLHQAAAELRAAQEMRQRIDKERIHQREKRIEEQLDESAGRRWQAATPHSAGERAA